MLTYSWRRSAPRRTSSRRYRLGPDLRERASDSRGAERDGPRPGYRQRCRALLVGTGEVPGPAGDRVLRNRGRLSRPLARRPDRAEEAGVSGSACSCWVRPADGCNHLAGELKTAARHDDSLAARGATRDLGPLRSSAVDLPRRLRIHASFPSRCAPGASGARDYDPGQMTIDEARHIVQAHGYAIKSERVWPAAWARSSS